MVTHHCKNDEEHYPHQEPNQCSDQPAPELASSPGTVEFSEVIHITNLAQLNTEFPLCEAVRLSSQTSLH